MLVFRNIPTDLEMAKLVAIIVLCLVSYFLLVNIMGQSWAYVLVESAGAIFGFYVVYQLDALQKAERGGSTEFRKG
jgi:hypothetical protein